MYIKQIIVQGFKSYKETTIIEPFSPGTNVVVGRNGSGKSNFFAAIRFVLSDAYTQMSREERQALLHEGSGSAVTSAYVEIIFDNSDDRFPTGHDEVVLRRTIALKKDEYSVDRKVVTKSDVVNLLEAAGFSRSNPYYIVPQGRVTALTNMKESDRLNLLKEVAGTHVYEARRAESLKIMNETNNKREKIDELLDYIKERLSELEEEKEELRGFQDKDRERRCLEYAFYHREQVQVQEALDDIERAREGSKDSTDELRAEFVRGEKAIAKLDSEIHRVHRDMDLLRIEKRQLEEDRRETAKIRAKAELNVKSLSDGQAAKEQAMAHQEADLNLVRTEIATREKELAKITPDLARRKKDEDKARKDFETADAQRNRLLNKQTRSSQFRNKAERDAWLRDQIADLNLNLGTQKANRMDADEEVRRVEGSIKQMDKEVTTLRNQLEGWGQHRSSAQEVMREASDVVEKLQDERKALLRADQKLESLKEDARQEKEQAERELAHAMDGATSRGLASIRRLKQEKDIPGAHGTLAELLEVSDAYKLPVEQVAGASLFHYIVDDEETATYLANHLYKKHAGRVTFMPLNQLRPRPVNLPRTSDAVPILQKLQYAKKFEKAFQQVFGKTVLCANLTIAGQYARSHGVDGITAEGDTTNKRGAMTGGYIDPRKSRLDAVKMVSKWRGEFDQKVAEHDDIRRQIELKNQEINRAMGEQQKAAQKLRQVEHGYNPLTNDLRIKLSHLENERGQLEAATRRRDAVDKNMKDFGESISALEAELAADFKKALSPAEEQELEELGRRVAEFRHQWKDTRKKWQDLEQRRQILEVELRHNLQPKLDQLNANAFENSSLAGTGGSSNLKEAQRELKRLQKTSGVLDGKLQEAEAQLEGQQEQIDNMEARKADTEQLQQDTAAKIERQQKRIEKNLQRRALLSTQAAECAKNIRDLGVLPEEAFEKYESMDSKTITSKLKRVNEALKKFKHVNKKAFEQYNSFTTQQDQLMKRRKELDQSQASIEELVAHLDQRKDEAIERTFKQVSKEFATIFEKLVPAGHGRLVIQRRTDRRQEPEESDGDEHAAVENYTGVGISVSFNSKQFDEQQRIQQLSGGQKSLCALCLIFALQQTESSPMVIFDEVDANLDAQYRTAVAALLQSISREAGTQFICTTFRPEIVHVADKCYGVTFHNKTSSIDCVPAETALNFVDGQQKR